MAAVLKRYSKITEKGQITVPKDVRDALGVRQGGRIAWRIEGEHVAVYRVDETENEDDPALNAFLSFLERDIRTHPQSVAALSPALVERIAGLIEGVDVDPEEEIAGDVAL